MNRTYMTHDKSRSITNTQAIAGIALSSFIVLILTITMEAKLQRSWQDEQIAAVLTAKPQAQKGNVEKITAQVKAKSAIVYDINSGKVLYNKNADMQLPIASITKLMTALVAEREFGATNLISISERALLTEGESGLVAGDFWRVRDLSDFMLTISSNDAATALALAGGDKMQFISKMNSVAQELGLWSTVFFNESGLDVNNVQAGGYSSARDIANLLTYIVSTQPTLLEATTFAEFNSVSQSGLRYRVINTNKITGKIPGLIASKTGFTDLAGGNLAIVFDAGVGRPIVIVVLGSTIDGRFDDVLNLVSKVI